jgi:hypothetical protein
VVADTNVIISALLWNGSPRRILEAAERGLIRLFSSPPLVAELEDVLGRSKFAPRLVAAGVSPGSLVWAYRSAIAIVEGSPIGPVIQVDPDDDQVLSCAIACHAEAIVSGDPHLLDMKEFRGVAILTPLELLSRLGPP